MKVLAPMATANVKNRPPSRLSDMKYSTNGLFTSVPITQYIMSNFSTKVEGKKKQSVETK